MKFLSRTLEVRTERGPQFVDITDEVEEVARECGLRNGFAVVFSKHTTAAIRINESEPHLIADMEQMLENVVPAGHEYAHNKYAHAVSTNGERPERAFALPATTARARASRCRSWTAAWRSANGSGSSSSNSTTAATEKSSFTS